MHFQVHNGARDTATRNTRAGRPSHGGLKQYVMNGERRLVRGRPIQITLAQLEKFIEEFRAKEKDGVLYVTTMDGRVVNLYDSRLPTSPTPPATNPRPNAPLDSAKNDKMSGVPMNNHRIEAPPPKEFSMPVQPPIAAVENNPVAPQAPAQEPPPPPAADEPAADITELAGLEMDDPAMEPPVETPAVIEQPVETAVSLEETSPDTADEQPAAEETSAPTETKSSGGKKDKKKKDR